MHYQRYNEEWPQPEPSVLDEYYRKNLDRKALNKSNSKLVAKRKAKRKASRNSRKNNR